MAPSCVYLPSWTRKVDAIDRLPDCDAIWLYLGLSTSPLVRLLVAFLEFIDAVVPELQARGLVQREYAQGT